MAANFKNQVVLSGFTSDLYCAGQKANFTLYIEDGHRTLIHVNVFDSLVEKCKEMKLRSGDFVTVCGELMNRTMKSSQKIVLEVKAHDITKDLTD
jgi:hypothetical protein